MSREALWSTVRMAWAMLAGGDRHEVTTGRARPPRPALVGDEPRLSREGFAEEALPWLDAVYRFALRLTRGDSDAAEDLTQETFLRAHRFWDRYERGTQVKSWLFTICRNTYLHEARRARTQREFPTEDIDAHVEALSAFGSPPPDPERVFFDDVLDEEVVEAIDALPRVFREVLVLSDLGDLEYAEIAEVLEIPVGTVRSRLFRARRILQMQLRDFAVRSGYVQETTP